MRARLSAPCRVARVTLRPGMGSDVVCERPGEAASGDAHRKGARQVGQSSTLRLSGRSKRHSSVVSPSTASIVRSPTALRGSVIPEAGGPVTYNESQPERSVRFNADEGSTRRRTRTTRRSVKFSIVEAPDEHTADGEDESNLRI